MFETLGEQLLATQIEWPPNQDRFFIPISELNQLMSELNVTQELLNIYSYVDDSLVRFICLEARKVFAILLCVSKPQSIRDFCNERLGDEDLPFTRFEMDGRVQLGRKDHIACIREYHGSCAIHAMDSWSQKAIIDFCRDQWVFEAPVFKSIGGGKIPHHHLADNCILPFIEDHEGQQNRTKSGECSDVWTVRTHPAHLFLPMSDRVSSKL
jgi:hypothetical protein